METMKIDFGLKFDWFDVLDRLIEGGKITESQFDELDRRAADWPQCACGQMCKLLPKQDHQSGAPNDELLRALGGSFATQVVNRNWEEARKVMGEIEKRSTKLLKDMGIEVELVEHPRTFKRKLPPLRIHQKPLEARLVDSRLDFRGHRR